MDLRGDWSSACPGILHDPRRSQVAPKVLELYFPDGSLQREINPRLRTLVLDSLGTQLRLDKEQPLAADLALVLEVVANRGRALVGERAQIFRRDREIRQDELFHFGRGDRLRESDHVARLVRDLFVRIDRRDQRWPFSIAD